VRNSVRIVLLILAVLFTAGFVWTFLSRSGDDWVGKPAPPTRGTDADGVAFQLSDYRGKVVMLEFWGDW
jgi:hypothetical protein